jgi:serine/threonine protein kinase
MRLAAGSRLGPYEIVAPIGAGGMGDVYRARDPKLNRYVALKILAARAGEDQAGSHWTATDHVPAGVRQVQRVARWSVGRRVLRGRAGAVNVRGADPRRCTSENLSPGQLPRHVVLGRAVLLRAQFRLQRDQHCDVRQRQDGGDSRAVRQVAARSSSRRPRSGGPGCAPGQSRDRSRPHLTRTGSVDLRHKNRSAAQSLSNPVALRHVRPLS